MQAADECGDPTSDVDDSPASPGKLGSDGDEDVGAEAARKLRGVSLKKRPKPQDSGEEVDGDAKRLAPSVSAPDAQARETHTYRLLIPASQRAAAGAVPHGGDCTVSVCTPVHGCDEVVVECSSSAGRSTAGDTFPDQAAVMAVLRACLVECDAPSPDGGASQGTDASLGGSGGGDDTTAQSAVVVARLLLPGSQAGAIIGRAGDNIRAVRQASGCAVRVLDADDNPGCVPPTERVVQLTGTWPQVAAALDLLLPLLKELSQRRGAGPVGLPKPAGSKPGGGSQARQAGLPGSASPGRSDTQAGGVASFSAHITVPSTSVGSIIGKSGANIAQIRAISGARIKVHDAVAGSSQRHIEIGGTAEQVAHAQVLVQGFLMTNPSIAAGSGKGGQQQLGHGSPMTFQQPMQLVAQAPHPMLTAPGWAMPVMMAPPGAMFAQGGQPGMPTLVYMHPGGAGYPAPVHMAQVFMAHQPQ